MFVLDAYRIFNKRFPEAVAESTFTALQHKEVRIAIQHDTRICFIHENIDVLLKVYISCLLVRAYHSLAVGLEVLRSEKHQRNYSTSG